MVNRTGPNDAMLLVDCRDNTGEFIDRKHLYEFIDRLIGHHSGDYTVHYTLQGNVYAEFRYTVGTPIVFKAEMLTPIKFW